MAVAAADITDEAKIIKRDGKPAGDGPYFGVGFDAETPGAERLTPFRLDSRPLGHRPGEVVLDAATAERPALPGRRHVPITDARPARSHFKVVGIARFGSVESLGTATSAVFDLRAAQKLFGRGEKLDGMLVAGARRGAAGAAARGPGRRAARARRS